MNKNKSKFGKMLRALAQSPEMWNKTVHRRSRGVFSTLSNIYDDKSDLQKTLTINVWLDPNYASDLLFYSSAILQNNPGNTVFLVRLAGI